MQCASWLPVALGLWQVAATIHSRQDCNIMSVQDCALWVQCSTMGRLAAALRVHQPMLRPGKIVPAPCHAAAASSSRVRAAPGSGVSCHVFSSASYALQALAAAYSHAVRCLPLVAPAMLTSAGIDPLMVQLIQSRVSAALVKDCAGPAALKGASEAVVPAAAAAAGGGGGQR
jgi:hypothetical protein